MSEKVSLENKLGVSFPDWDKDLLLLDVRLLPFLLSSESESPEIGRENTILFLWFLLSLNLATLIVHEDFEFAIKQFKNGLTFQCGNTAYIVIHQFHRLKY